MKHLNETGREGGSWIVSIHANSSLPLDWDGGVIAIVKSLQLLMQ